MTAQVPVTVLTGFLGAGSSGRTAHVWRMGDTASITFDHHSTVSGLAFDARGRRLAVAHYGGATVWEQCERRWKSSKLLWKGSHGAAAAAGVTPTGPAHRKLRLHEEFAGDVAAAILGETVEIERGRHHHERHD